MKRRSFRFSVVKISSRYATIIFIAFFYLAGLIAGAISRGFIGHNTEIRLLSLFKSLSTLNNGVGYTDIFMSSLFSNFILFFLVFFFGLSLAGIPLIVLANVYKGFGIGFTVGFLYSIYGFKGLLITLLTILPQAVLTSILIIWLSNEALRFSYTLVSIGGKGARLKAEFPETSMFVRQSIIIFLLTIPASFYETFISPFFIRILNV